MTEENLEQNLVEPVEDVEVDQVEEEKAGVEDVGEQKDDQEAEVVDNAEDDKKKVFKDKYLNPAQKGYVDRKLEKLEKLLKKQVDERFKVYDSAIERLATQKKQAIEDNDLKAYHEAAEQEKVILKAKETYAKDAEDLDVKDDNQEQEENRVTELEPEVETWVGQNKNFINQVESNPELQVLINGMSKALLKKEGYDKRSQVELLAEVKKRALAKFPEYFDSRNKTLPNVSSGKSVVSSPKKKSWNDIPQAERETLKAHINWGLYKDEDEAASEFFKN